MSNWPPNFTVTNEISSGKKDGSVKINQFEIQWRTLNDKKIVVTIIDVKTRVILNESINESTE